MKKLSFFLCLLFLGLIFSSCQKECETDASFNNVLNKESDLLTIKKDWTLVQSDTFGVYLSFRSKKSLDTFFKEMESFSDSQLDLWESQIPNFKSLRTSQIDNKVDPEKWYSSDVFATLLNEKGYIKVEGKIYQEVDNGSKVFLVDSEASILVYDSSFEIESRSSCLRDDDYKQSFDYCGLVPNLRVKGKIDHWKHYITGNERLYLKTWMWYQHCSGANGWKSAYGTLRFNGTYSVSVDGDELNGTINYVRYNDNYHRLTLASGDDICINSVNSDHKGSWNQASATASPSVE